MKNKANINRTEGYKYLSIFLIFLIFQSTTAQDQWRVFTTSNSPLPSNQIGTMVIDTNNVKWIGTNNGLVRIEGNIWTIYDTSNSPMPVNSCSVGSKDLFNNIWIRSANTGLVKSDGFNWTLYNTTNSGLPTNLTACINVDNNNIKWIGTATGLAKFDDNNWTIYNTTNSGLPHNLVKTLAIENNVKWIGTFSMSGGMAKFDDTNWVIYNTGNSQIPSNAINDIKIDYLGNKWICTYSGGLAKFNSVTNTWTIYDPLNSGIPSYYVYCINFRNNHVKFIGTETNGIAIFNDTSWQNFNSSNSPLPSDVISDIKIDNYNNVWITTFGGLVIYNPNTIIGINNINMFVGKDYELKQNYPNPFNPITTIKYELPKEGMITFKIYDILGKEIYSINEFSKAGIHELKFDGSNYASGVYFYSIEARQVGSLTGTYIETKKMVLVK